MRKYSLYIIIIMPLFINCTKTAPCEDVNLYCEGINYGTTKLSDSSLHWMPSIITQNLVYKNAATGITNIHKLKYMNQGEFKDILFLHDVTRPCGIAHCDDYCYSENAVISYTSDFAPFLIELKREKDYYEYLDQISKEKVEKSKDRLMINLSSRTDTSKFNFKVLFDRKDSSNGYKFYDSINLGTRRHYNVHECYYIRTNQTNYVKGIYYTTDNGLVGFYYDNMQLWYLQ